MNWFWAEFDDAGAEIDELTEAGDKRSIGARKLWRISHSVARLYRRLRSGLR